MLLGKCYIGGSQVQKAYLGGVEVISEGGGGGGNPSVFNIVPDAVRRYLSEVNYGNNPEYTGTSILTYIESGVYPGNEPVHATLKFQSNVTTLTLYTDSSKQNVWQMIALNGTECNIFNLIPNTSYWWVADNGEEGTFSTQGSVRLCYIPNLVNFRDLGGKTTTDGKKVKYGRIYRGCEANGEHGYRLTEEGIAIGRNILGIGAELDFRLGYEVDNNTPDDPSDDITSSAFGDDILYGRYELHSYRYIAGYGEGEDEEKTKTAALNCFRFVLNALSQNKPVYNHCWAGADRTGTFCWLLLGLLRVYQDQMDKDFELTSFSEIGGRFRNVFGTQAQPSGIGDLAVNYLATFNGSTLHERIESLWKYIGVTDAEIAQFRSLMLE